MLCIHNTLKSTSYTVQEIIKLNSAPSFPFAVLALQQTNGRGRLNKLWSSPLGNLYCNFVFPYNFVANFTDSKTVLNSAVSIISALAIKDLLTYYLASKDIAIKWPNDIMVNNEKISGILIEQLTNDFGKNYFSIGIGINVNSLPSVIGAKFKPTCIKNHIFKQLNVLELASLLQNLLLRYFKQYKNGFIDINTLVMHYKESLIFLGKNIIFKQGSVLLEGVCLGINKNGFLLLKEHETGAFKELSSGEVLHYEN